MKILFLALSSFCTMLLLHSCTVENTSTYHKDQTQSNSAVLDIKEFLTLADTFMPNQDEEFTASMENLKKVPTTWSTLYDVGEKLFAMKAMPEKGNDTLDLFKKIMIKSNYQGGDFDGISLKYDRFSAKDTQLLNAIFSNTNYKIPYPNAAFANWKSKKLIIETDQLVAAEIQNFFTTTLDQVENQEKRESQLHYLVKIFEMNYTNILKFDQKIKTIEGSHPWISKKDDYTIHINYKISEFYSKNYQKEKYDRQIIVTTE